MTRQEANQEIIKRLSKIAEDYPELRFAQIIHGLGFERLPFYEESEITLKLAKWENFDG